jgi:hypothetical protein
MFDGALVVVHVVNTTQHRCGVDHTPAKDPGASLEQFHLFLVIFRSMISSPAGATTRPAVAIPGLPAQSRPAGTISACRRNLGLPAQSRPAGATSACRRNLRLPAQPPPAGANHPSQDQNVS